MPTNAIGTDAFQEANMLEITKGCTKAQIQVKDTADFPRAINEAFYIAMSGRPYVTCSRFVFLNLIIICLQLFLDNSQKPTKIVRH